MSQKKLVEDADDDVELGDEVENLAAGRSRGPVLAVRVSPDLLARLQAYAATRGMTVSEAVRRGAEQLVEGTVNFGPTHVTGTVITGPNLVYGSATGATGRSAVRVADAGKAGPELTTPG